ncbi:MAG TPA: Xaa-Pro aminopeptidase [Candidatus Saccharimonadales bacterium]
MDGLFFSANRKRLGETLTGAPLIVTAYTQTQRRADMAWYFEQESNFWWLTGIDAPDWQLIVDTTRHKSWLVAPDVDEVHKVFDGSLSYDVALQQSGADEVLTHRQADEKIAELARLHSVVYTVGDDPQAAHYNFALNPASVELKRQLGRIFKEVRTARPELNKLRAIKQAVELEAMQRAIDMTIDGFVAVRDKMQAFKYEYEIDAEFSYLFRRRGAEGHAYDPIAAGGHNACTLHYVANTERLKKRQLVLLDIGARAGGYAADITRTYAFGEPTKRQIEIHAAVQLAQQEIITSIEPNLSVEEYQRNVDAVMTEALLSVGLMKSRDDTDSYHRYFPHAISHGLGVDVHDSLGAPKFLQPGMVLTVEPGIYIPEEGIGVRIEDDILVTTSGHKNMSQRLSTDL